MMTDKREVPGIKSVAATKEKEILFVYPVRGLSSVNDKDKLEAAIVDRSDEVLLVREGSV